MNSRCMFLPLAKCFFVSTREILGIPAPARLHLGWFDKRQHVWCAFCKLQVHAELHG